MQQHKKMLIIGALTFAGLLQAADTCGSNNNYPRPTSFYVPYGYTKIKSDEGNCLYRSSDSKTYIQVVDLKAGAKVRFVVGDYVNTQTLPNGKDGKMYTKKGFKDFKNDALKNSKTFSVINGQFFDINRQPTFLSLPLKYNGHIYSNGPDMRDRNVNSFRTLIIKRDNYYSNSAIIYNKYSESAFNNNSNVIVGFSPFFDEPEIRSGSSIERTFVGVRNGKYSSSSSNKELLIIAVSKKATTEKMRNILKSWYVDLSDMAMFDGGGSTQFYFKNGTELDSGRPIPMVFQTLNHGLT